MRRFSTAAEVIRYVEAHELLMGELPNCVGLRYDDYVSVALDAGLSIFQARCTNVTFKLHGVDLVRVG